MSVRFVKSVQRAFSRTYSGIRTAAGRSGGAPSPLSEERGRGRDSSRSSRALRSSIQGLYAAVDRLRHGAASGAPKPCRSVAAFSPLFTKDWRYASMKPSRSPSSTRSTSPTSKFVRWSLMSL